MGRKGKGKRKRGAEEDDDDPDNSEWEPGCDTQEMEGPVEYEEETEEEEEEEALTEEDTQSQELILLDEVEGREEEEEEEGEEERDEAGGGRTRDSHDRRCKRGPNYNDTSEYLDEILMEDCDGESSDEGDGERGGGGEDEEDPQPKDERPDKPENFLRNEVTNEKETVALAIFNAKGGVLKTTHTWALSFSMCKMRGLTVLVNDLDSQCDAARTMLKSKVRGWEAANLQAWRAENGLDDPLPESQKGFLNFMKRPITDEETARWVRDYGIQEQFNLPEGHPRKMRLVRTAQEALTPLSVETFVHCVIPEEVDMENIPGLRNAGKMWITVGGDLFQDVADRVGQADVAPTSNPSAPLFITAVQKVCRTIAAAVEADIMFYDLNPSLQILNRNMLLDADYIILATKPEDFSTENSVTLCKKLTKNHEAMNWQDMGTSWLQRYHYHVRREVNADIAPGVARPIKLRETLPKFLGYIMGDFMAGGGKGHEEKCIAPLPVEGVYHDRAAQASETEMDRQYGDMYDMLTNLQDVQVEAKGQIAPPGGMSPVTHVQMSIPEAVYEELNQRCLLGKIRNHWTCGPFSQHFGVPVGFLTRAQLSKRVDVAGRSKGNNKALVSNLVFVEQFRQRYDQCAYNILALINKDPSDGRLHEDAEEPGSFVPNEECAGLFNGRLTWCLMDNRSRWGGGPPTAEEIGNEPFLAVIRGY